MNAADAFNTFFAELHVSSSQPIESLVAEMETYYSSAMLILQKNEDFFSQARMLGGINLSEHFSDKKDVIWKNLTICMMASFLHGDLREKVGKVLDLMKNMWNGNDEITNILNDTSSESKFQEILDYIQNTRLAKLFLDIVENFDISDIEINVNNSEDIMNMMRNPEHPVVKRVVSRLQGILKSKMERGEINKSQIVSEIEGIKAKITSMFGNIFNNALGGTRSETPSHILMGNSPEARRQRMLARLQKKQREKNSY